MDSVKIQVFVSEYDSFSAAGSVYHDGSVSDFSVDIGAVKLPQILRAVYGGGV